MVSTYTKQQLKVYKSLEGYRYFVDGWIQEVFVWLVPSKTNACVVYRKVKHSQDYHSMLTSISNVTLKISQNLQVRGGAFAARKIQGK